MIHDISEDWHSGTIFDCDAGDPSSNPECLTALLRAVKTKKKYIHRTSKSDIGLSGGYQKDVLNIRPRHLSDIRRTALCYVVKYIVNGVVAHQIESSARLPLNKEEQSPSTSSWTHSEVGVLSGVYFP
ncbi:hypothetical protein OUZ56_011564 [Daphnia magna]|uniref:Uncharacterized protein n=1 Tax=Daphnia magna TaxID=35525 RepID=A0ABQ9Z0H4_9CRUS|nr:hypothetical protein OUZ56_011564 [Daphnia magna]